KVHDDLLTTSAKIKIGVIKMFKGIEENDNVLVDSEKGIFEGRVSSLTDNFITIHAYVDDSSVMIKKDDVIEINKKAERKTTVKAEVKQSIFFGIQAVAEMKSISVDEAVARVLDKYTWKEVDFLKSVNAVVDKVNKSK